MPAPRRPPRAVPTPAPATPRAMIIQSRRRPPLRPGMGAGQGLRQPGCPERAPQASWGRRRTSTCCSQFREQRIPHPTVLCPPFWDVPASPTPRVHSLCLPGTSGHGRQKRLLNFAQRLAPGSGGGGHLLSPFSHSELSTQRNLSDDIPEELCLCLNTAGRRDGEFTLELCWV